MSVPSLDNIQISVIGLGYVGLPLALAFSKKFPVVAYDVDAGRISELNNGFDRTGEASAQAFEANEKLWFTSDKRALEECNCYIIAVPTPVDDFNQPDFEALTAATKLVGECIKDGDVVIFESTVFPGATEEICVPILAETSGLDPDTDDDARQQHCFYFGYSPERVNPGDPNRGLEDIVKVTSGSSKVAADFVDALYAGIIKAGTHKAASVKTAEAAKVIENIQRDVNIALINEFALIFDRLGLSTEEVLKAAGTKWNFIPFKPGLVGGHCIGVDPYYLTHIALQQGYDPQMILAGRRVNEQMSVHVARKVIDLMLKKGIEIQSSRILLMGATFKEDCPDTRNSKAEDVLTHLIGFSCEVDVYDPVADKSSLSPFIADRVVNAPGDGCYDAVVIVVGHSAFRELGIDAIRRMTKPKHVIFDVKWLFEQDATDGRL